MVLLIEPSRDVQEGTASDWGGYCEATKVKPERRKHKDTLVVLIVVLTMASG